MNLRTDGFIICNREKNFDRCDSIADQLNIQYFRNSYYGGFAIAKCWVRTKGKPLVTGNADDPQFLSLYKVYAFGSGGGGIEPLGFFHRKEATQRSVYLIAGCKSSFWESPACVSFGSMWRPENVGRVESIDDLMVTGTIACLPPTT